MSSRISPFRRAATFLPNTIWNLLETIWHLPGTFLLHHTMPLWHLLILSLHHLAPPDTIWHLDNICHYMTPSWNLPETSGHILRTIWHMNDTIWHFPAPPDTFLTQSKTFLITYDTFLTPYDLFVKWLYTFLTPADKPRWGSVEYKLHNILFYIVHIKVL